MPDPKTLLHISKMGQIIETPTGQCMKPAEVGGLWKCGGYDGYKEVGRSNKIMNSSFIWNK